MSHTHTHTHTLSGSNTLLSRLPAADLAALMPKLTPVLLVQNDVLYAADGPIEAAYFPMSGLLSMICRLEDGMQAEVGLVGPEGMVGTPLAAGIKVAPVECVVQLSGRALRMDAASFRGALDTVPKLREAVFRHNEAMLAQAVQAGPCNARHDLPQRLARWLLAAHDRVDGDEMALTQEFLAAMLAAHRPSVTLAAGELQRMGAIRHRHGRVTVVDRAALERCSCECYAAVRRRSDRLPGPARIS